MTHKEFLVDALSEITGRPKERFLFFLSFLQEPGKLNDEISPEEAEVLKEAMLREAPGILACLVKGAMEAWREIERAENARRK